MIEIRADTRASMHWTREEAYNFDIYIHKCIQVAHIAKKHYVTKAPRMPRAVSLTNIVHTICSALCHMLRGVYMMCDVYAAISLCSFASFASDSSANRWIGLSTCAEWSKMRRSIEMWFSTRRGRHIEQVVYRYILLYTQTNTTQYLLHYNSTTRAQPNHA